MSARSTIVLLGLALLACEDAPQSSAATGEPKPTESAPVATSAPTASASAPVVPTADDTTPPADFELEELPEATVVARDLAEQRAAMFRRMRVMHQLDEKQLSAIEAIFEKTKWMGQGNPDVVEHPMTRAECVDKRRTAGARERRSARCKAPYMAAIWDPATQTEETATVCIDRYEFPNMPCDYPVTWVTTAQAQSLCQAMGKRLCDAHEWEGACAGAVLPADKEYAFGMPRITMQGLHNMNRGIRWAYGEKKDHAKCGTTSKKSKTCTAPGWKACASNTFPAGAFPECRSPFGVYDLHGNAAEHMWLPLKADQVGGKKGALPEMKGSWFIFSQHEAHIDDCRWRAPPWHENEGNQHSNYHLGFRCCKDL